LAGAPPDLVVVGHITLDVTAGGVRQTGRDDAMAGKRHAMQYFYAYELPKVAAWLAVVQARDPVCRDMRDEWF